MHMQNTLIFHTHDSPSVMALIKASCPCDTFGTNICFLLLCLAVKAGCQLWSKTRGLPGGLSGLGFILGLKQGG